MNARGAVEALPTVTDPVNMGYQGKGGKAGPAARQPDGGGSIAISTRRHYQVLADHAAAAKAEGRLP